MRKFVLPAVFALFALLAAPLFGATYNDSNIQKVATAETTAYLRVKISSITSGVPTVAAAGVADVDIGVLTPDLVNVSLATAGGSFPILASGAVTANTLVYPAASGKVSATVTGVPIGIALETGTDVPVAVYRFQRGRPLPITANLIATTVDNYVFIADRPMTVTGIRVLIGVASTSGTLAVRKITAAGTALPGATAGATCIELMTGTIDLASAAGTTVSGTLVTTAGVCRLAAGDKIAIDIGGTMTNLIGVLTIESIPD